MGASRLVALSIEAGEVRLLATDGQRITAWGTEPLAPGVVKNGLVLDAPSVASAIETLLDAQRLTRSKVVSSVAGIRCFPRSMQLPKIGRKLLAEAIPFESEREMPLPLTQLYIAPKQLSEGDLEHQFFVVGMLRNCIDAQAHALDLARLKSYLLDLKPIALARAVNRREAVIVDLEPWGSELVLVADGVPIMARILHVKGQEPTAEDRVRQAAVEVTRTVEFYNSGKPETLVDSNTPVLLTGRLASDPEVVDLAKTVMGNSTEAFEPAFEYPDQLPAPEYAASIGLAMKGGAPGRSRKGATFPALDLPIIPDSHRTLQSQKKLVLSGLVGVFLVALLSVTFQLNLDRGVEVADLRFQVENLDRQLQDAQQTIESIDSIRSEVDGLAEEARAVLGSGDRFVEALDFILGDMPPGVTPTAITVKADSVTLQGIATTRSSALNYVEFIDRTRSFSAVQLASLKAADPDSSDQVMQFTVKVER